MKKSLQTHCAFVSVRIFVEVAQKFGCLFVCCGCICVWLCICVSVGYLVVLVAVSEERGVQVGVRLCAQRYHLSNVFRGLNANRRFYAYFIKSKCRYVCVFIHPHTQTHTYCAIDAYLHRDNETYVCVSVCAFAFTLSFVFNCL